MSFKVQVRRAAELDAAEAQIWYEAQRDGLGAEFHSEISRVFTVLTETPLIYPACIEMPGERLFIASRISSGIAFLASRLRFSPVRTLDRTPARSSLVFDRSSDDI